MKMYGVIFCCKQRDCYVSFVYAVLVSCYYLRIRETALWGSAHVYWVTIACIVIIHIAKLNLHKPMLVLSRMCIFQSTNFLIH